MEKVITLKKNKDFRRIYVKGNSFVSPFVVTYIHKNRSSENRLGITTSKKIGNAVKRNRARRVIRQAYNELLPNLNNGYDFVFVARGKTPFVKSTDILNVISSQLKKAGVLK